MDGTVFILIALLKTPGEGGVVQIPFQTNEECEAAGADLTKKFGDAYTWDTTDGEAREPKVIFTCLPAPRI